MAHLDEEEALAKAKKEGIEFEDSFYIEGNPEERFDTRDKAEKKAKEGDNIMQERRQKRDK